MTDLREVETPHGPARLHVDRARSPRLTLVLGHGAGGGVDARDLAALAYALPREGFTVVRVEQPWRVAGKKVAPAPRILDEGLLACLKALRLRTPLVVGGRSAGARSACRVAGEVGAAGVLALAFPLHPPGKPEKSRASELLALRVPTLVVQGDNDAFGNASELPERFGAPGEVAAVPFADHGFKVAQKAARGAGIDQDAAMLIVVEAVLEWLTREVME